MSDFALLLTLFGVLMLSAEWIGRGAKRLRLPVITGFLAAGILIGPYVLGVLTAEDVVRLRVLDQIALSFIAFAAGAELHYREIRQQLRRIWWITFGIVAASYALVVPVLTSLGESVPFLAGLDERGRLGVAFVAAAILVSRSPSSLMALVSELRARGPFTRLLMGVTVALDVVVILLFAVSTSVADVLLRSADFEAGLLLLVAGELLVAGVAGALVGGLLHWLLSLTRNLQLRALLLLGVGLGVYAASGAIRRATHEGGPFEIFIEPLLVCLVAGFVVSNLSSFRNDFERVLKATGPFVYLGFFTLAGASLDLASLGIAWRVALLLLLVRLVAMIAGTWIGGWVGGAPANVRRRVWFGMLTQAGIGLGLAKEVAVDFPEWGGTFATTMIAVIVVNQVLGPPPAKWILRRVGEARADLTDGVSGAPRALVFGLDTQAWALARQLLDHGWRTTLVTRREVPVDVPPDLEVVRIDQLSASELRRIGADSARTLIGLMDEDANVELSRLAHDELGVSNVVARVSSQEAGAACRRYGATAIDPSVALVNVLDHFVRSPALTGMVVGMDDDRDIVEIPVRSPQLHGIALRDLQLPLDVLVLSVERDGASILCHGYTRLRRGDRVTVLGHRGSLEQIEDRLAG